MTAQRAPTGPSVKKQLLTLDGGAQENRKHERQSVSKRPSPFAVRLSNIWANPQNDLEKLSLKFVHLCKNYQHPGFKLIHRERKHICIICTDHMPGILAPCSDFCLCNWLTGPADLFFPTTAFKQCQQALPSPPLDDSPGRFLNFLLLLVVSFLCIQKCTSISLSSKSKLPFPSLEPTYKFCKAPQRQGWWGWPGSEVRAESLLLVKWDRAF